MSIRKGIGHVELIRQTEPRHLAYEGAHGDDIASDPIVPWEAKHEERTSDLIETALRGRLTRRRGLPR